MANIVMNRLEEEIAQAEQRRANTSFSGPQAYQGGGMPYTIGQNPQYYGGPQYANQGQYQPYPQGGQQAAPSTPYGQYHDRYEVAYQQMEKTFHYDEGASITFNDIINKTSTMMGIMLVGALVGWFLAAHVPGLGLLAIVGGGIIALVAGIIAAVKRSLNPTIYIVYAASEGLLLGGISQLYEAEYPAIVSQAVIGTAAIFASTLLLYRMRLVRNSPKLMRFVAISFIAILIYAVINLVLVLFNLTNGPFGLDSMTLFGLPIGIVISLYAIFVGAAALVVDFDIAERAVTAGASKKFAWVCSFGIVLDTVYIYVYVLRLLALLRRD
ncbi:MAG: Bax inhibitor-1/YccA family protein [Actinomycetaceae bacterium]|nr:Bax inhibitor-1/YccA family protein [Actinomycetaceae bacterium]